jgi:hypothetical protein
MERKTREKGQGAISEKPSQNIKSGLNNRHWHNKHLYWYHNNLINIQQARV